MYSYTNDLILTTTESHLEANFNSKCQDLLMMYGKDCLIERIKNPVLFDYFFTSHILPRNEVHHILLRKYYLSKHDETQNTKVLDAYIKTSRFEEINELLINYPSVRSEVLGIYIDNINVSNHQLSIEKLEDNNYDDINLVLIEMDQFYQQKMSNPKLALKKSYKF